MSISPTGKLIVACHNRNTGLNESFRRDDQVFYGKPYAAQLYPGRVVNSTHTVLHVWDRHGRALVEDAVPGIPQTDGVFLDARDGIYVMATPSRIYDGQRYFEETSETLIKFQPKRAKIYSTRNTPIEMDLSNREGTPAVVGSQVGRVWVEGAEWMYGGVGFGAFNEPKAVGCACWHGRFAVDYYGRSFAPAPLQFNVAVVDAAGNLILRIGRYGNVDDGVPLASAARDDDASRPRERAERPRSLGGDEVGLFHACFTGTHTDKRLFIADVGNCRILSVKLDYHTNETIPLKDALPRAGGDR
jgi:hypothetical protein